MNEKYPGMPKALSLLIVEDEARLRELLIDVASEMGFTATGARSAEEARRMMEGEPRQVIILDLNLPGMSGLEFFELVREKWAAAQVIILTGFGDLDAARQAVHLDAVEFLTKPSPLDKIEKALDRARRRVDEARQQSIATESPWQPDSAPGTTLEASERRLILAALARNGGNRTAAAQELGISRRTLHYRLQQYEEQGLLPDEET